MKIDKDLWNRMWSISVQLLSYAISTKDYRLLKAVEQVQDLLKEQLRREET